MGQTERLLGRTRREVVLQASPSRRNRSVWHTSRTCVSSTSSLNSTAPRVVGSRSRKATGKEGRVGVNVRSDELLELVEDGAEVERVATGFTFTEGPIWNASERCLFFSDMPADIRRRWSEEDGVAEVRNPSNKCNGMVYDADGNLLVCEHVTSSLVRESPDGGRETIASHFEGKELNSPNDVITSSDGTILFSDPWYGRMPVFGVERERELGFQGVYRIASGGGEPELVCDRDEFDMPNGLCFSPDESLLYINDTSRAHIKVFDA
ncbi:MAG: SMP-30/gluconolactonase/LRE family protein, partial [Actinobacteria bacterium]|nr:SMP-30/gluconolactonase/LRE family protein [Actinomycetota bacterium]